MRHLCFRLVTFFLHVKPDLLILVQAIVRVVQIYFKKLILLRLVNVRVYNVFPRLIYKTIVSCRLINKNVLEWFLLVTCKKHTLRWSTNLLSRNHPTCFWLRRWGRQIPPILYFTIRSNCPESYNKFLESDFYYLRKCLFYNFSNQLLLKPYLR